MVLSLCSGITISAATMASGTCGDNLTWVLDSSGLLTISGTGAMTDWDSYRYAPWYSYKEYIRSVDIKSGATNIGNYAFYAYDYLKNIVIPDGVISIGEHAFYDCDSLTSINIPNSVTTIGEDAFSNCTALTAVYYTGSLEQWDSIVKYPNNEYLTDATMYFTGISASGYCGDNLTWQLLENGTLVILGMGEMTDWLSNAAVPWHTYQSNIYAVNIENGVTSIGSCAFYYCKNLNQITIPNSVENIADMAFYSCDSLSNIKIPHSVTRIGYSAFENCDSLSLVTIPNSVTMIGDSAFSGCDGLNEITIPCNVTNIGASAFYGCSKLVDVRYTGTQKQWEDISIGLSNDPLFNAIVHYASVSNVGTCGENLNWQLLDSGVLIISGTGDMSNYVYTSTVPWDRFRNAITTVIINNGVTSISPTIFYDCIKLTSVTIPDGITSIGGSAFKLCKNLAQITLPDSITYMGDEVFMQCASLSSIKIPKGITTLEWSMFEGCSSLVNITIPNSVTEFSDSVFRDCVSLQNITIPNSVTILGSSSFENCISLKRVAIPKSVTSISNYAFTRCIKLTDVLIPNSVTELATGAFEGCISLKNITIPNGITKIASKLISSCSSLTSITIPSSVVSIGLSAFDYCDELIDVYYMGTQEQWNEISIDSSKEILTTANIHYNSVMHYTIFYNANGGNGAPSAQTKPYGEMHTLSTTKPTRFAHVFLGWALSSNATEASYLPGESYPYDTNITLFAVWKEPIVLTTSTFMSETAFIDEGGALQYFKFTPSVSATYAFTSLANSDDTYGYLFDENGNQLASDDDGGDDRNFKVSYAFTATNTYYFAAKYYDTNKTGSFDVELGRQYAISYNANGGNGVPETQTKLHGKPILLSQTVPTKIDYNFLGWSTSAAATSAMYQPGENYTGNADCTLYAVWSDGLFKIDYNYIANGGISVTKTSEMVGNGSLADLSVKAIKPGWDLVGWNTDPNATTALASYTASGDTILYAIYKKTLTASFYYRTNLLQTTKTVNIYNNNTSASLTMPSLLGYSGWTALGWRDDTTADVQEYNATTTVTISSDQSYYGVYQRTITLSYNGGGGESIPNVQTAVQYYNANGVKTSHTITLARAINREHYIFSGWALGSTTGTAYKAGDSVTISDDTTMYALWDAVMYTVSYDYATNGGSSATKTSATVQSGSFADLSGTATKLGWDFVGWNTDPNAKTILSSYTVSGNVTLYAIFVPQVVAAVVSNKNPGDVPYGTEIVLTVDDLTDTYVIYYTTDGSEPGIESLIYTEPVVIEDDVTIYATPVGSLYGKGKMMSFAYTVPKFTITYHANGGVSEPAVQIKKYGQAVQLSTVVPERSGFVFVGWVKSPNDTSVAYQPGGTYMAEENITLYALWEKEEAAYPTLSVLKAEDITATSACLTGKVEDDGGATILNRYFVYYEKNKPNAKYRVSADADFVAVISNLKENTEYWFYATANNAVGFGDSSIGKFTTLGGQSDEPALFEMLSDHITVTVGAKSAVAYKLLPTTAANKNILWMSADERVASISNDGVITGNSVGTTTVTGITEVGRLQQSCTITVLEGKTTDVLDFSEWNMVTNTSNKSTIGWDLATQADRKQGGNIQRAISYLTRWDGPVWESEDVYPTGNDGEWKEIGNPLYHVQDVVFIPTRKNALDNDGIKNALMQYGAVHSSYYSTTSLYNADQSTYYSPYGAGNAHAIVIVGWDDNFPAERFVRTPDGPGAFICKNSYGADVGENGFLYISYYDQGLGIKSFSCAYSGVEDAGNYSKIYQYDPLGPTVAESFGAGERLLCANAFPEDGSVLLEEEQLAAVSFYTCTSGMRCKIYVVTNFTDASSLKYLGAPVIDRTIENAGYHTVKLTDSITLSPGTRFAIVVETIDSATGKARQYIEQPIRYYSKAQAGVNESFYSLDGIRFVDMADTTNYQSTNACIKAFTNIVGETARSIQGVNNESRVCTAPVSYTVEEIIENGGELSEAFITASEDIQLMSDTDEETVLEDIPSSIEIGNDVDYLDGGVLPESFDLRNANVITSAKNQGAFFNCWAFAAVAALESAVLKKIGEGAGGELDGSFGEEVSLQGISFVQSGIVIAKGAEQQLSIQTNPVGLYADVIFESSDTTVVTVNTGGKITGVGLGTATITAYCGKLTAQCSIMVTEGAAVTDIALKKTSVTAEQGRKLFLDYTIYPSNAISNDVTWKSSDESICVVNENGVVTLHGIGVATVTATTADGAFSDSCEVNVRSNNLPGLISVQDNTLVKYRDFLYGTVGVKINNYQAQTEGKLYIAVYDADGKFISMQSKPMTMAYDAYDATVDFDLEKISAAEGYVKAFFWDGKNITPLANTAEATW